MSKIGSTYAKALFDVALEENVLETMKADFNAFVEALKLEPSYMDVLKHPKLSKEDKKSLVSRVLANNTSHLLTNFLMVLIDKDRINMLGEILVSFNEAVNTHLGITEGTVYSAVALSEEQLQTLTDTFTKKLAKEVKFNVVLDSSLIGGFKVSVNNVVYDNSIKLQLKHLKDNLMNVELK